MVDRRREQLHHARARGRERAVRGRAGRGGHQHQDPLRGRGGGGARRAGARRSGGAPARARRIPGPAGRHAQRHRREKRVATEQVAWMNGLSPDAHVIAGTVLKLPTGAAPAQAQAAAPPPAAARGGPRRGALPHPGLRELGADRPDRGRPRRTRRPRRRAGVAGERIQQRPGLAGQRPRRDADPARHLGLDRGEPGHEPARSGLARGERPRRRDVPGPAAADAGGDPATAVASYYQGAGSVGSDGLLPDTHATWTTCSRCARASAG